MSIITNSLKWLALIWVAQFTSCTTLKSPEFRKIDNVQLAEAGLKSSGLTLDLYYFNPNKKRLVLKSAEGDAWLEDNLLGHFVIDSVVSIPALTEFRLPVKLQLDMDKLLKNSIALMLKKEVLLRIEGKAKAGKGGIFINHPIRYEGRQNVAELLQLSGKK